MLVVEIYTRNRYVEVILLAQTVQGEHLHLVLAGHEERLAVEAIQDWSSGFVGLYYQQLVVQYQGLIFLGNQDEAVIARKAQDGMARVYFQDHLELFHVEQPQQSVVESSDEVLAERC